VVAAEVEAVRRELEHDLAGRQLEAASDRLRFAADVASARLQVLEILAVLAPDRITLADLQRDVASYGELLAQEMVSVREYERVQAEHDALSRRVDEHQSLLERARQELVAAERRAEAAARRDDALPEHDPALAAASVLAARVTALERQLDAVRVRAEGLQLTAPFDAVVTQIAASPGQMVRPGDTVLTLAESRPEQIVVWVDEESARRLQERGELEAMVIQDVGGRKIRTRCPVGRVGVTVQTMPPELWPAANLPQRGRPVVLAVPSELHVVPGELVTVRWG
jgi:multidrug resistance efflux pump